MGYKPSNTKSIPPVEPSCKKRVYYTSQEAQDMIKYLNENKTGKEISVYRCTVCGFWHLTSKPWK